MRRFRSRDGAIDAALAVAATALNVAILLAPDPSTSYDYRDSHGLGVVLAAACGLCLLWRRTRPLASFLVIVSVTGLVTSLSWDPGHLPFTVLLSGYALGAFGTLSAGGVGLGVASGWFALLSGIGAPHFASALGVAELGGVMVAVWLLGQAVAHRQVQAERARDRAIAVARDGARESERTILAERLRVARELNGVVTDTLTAITLEAASASGDVGADRAVLESVEKASRAAAADLRRMLRALRDPNDAVIAEGNEPELRASLLRATGWRSTRRPPSDRQPEPGRPAGWSVDLAIGVSVVLLNVAGSIVPDTTTSVDYAEPVWPIFVVLAAVPGLALIVRRRYPVATLIAVGAVLTTVDALGWQTGNLPGSVVLATYALGAWAPARRGIVALLAMYVAVAAATWLGLPHHDEGALWEALVIFTAPWVIGAVIRHRREADRQHIERLLTMERELAAATERAVAEERLSIARDLHDLVSHNLAAITVQAAAARRSGHGTATADALAVIEEAGRAALADLRRMLTAVSDPTGEAALTPSPGLPELEQLVDLHRKAHGPVKLTVDAAIADEPDSLRLTAYRLVQESLTNVARHAQGAPTTVRLDTTSHGLLVRVENDSPDPPRKGGPVPGGVSGFGLAGMRERVSVFGGNLAAAETEAGGFLVSADLPRRDMV